MTGRLLVVAAVLVAASCAYAGAAPPPEEPASPPSVGVWAVPIRACIVLSQDTLARCTAACIADQADALTFPTQGWELIPCRVVREDAGTES